MKILKSCGFLALSLMMAGSGMATVVTAAGNAVAPNVVRIDHPRGQPTFAYVPAEPLNSVAVYIGDRAAIGAPGFAGQVVTRPGEQWRVVSRQSARGRTITQYERVR